MLLNITHHTLLFNKQDDTFKQTEFVALIIIAVCIGPISLLKCTMYNHVKRHVQEAWPPTWQTKEVQRNT